MNTELSPSTSGQKNSLQRSKTGEYVIEIHFDGGLSPLYSGWFACLTIPDDSDPKNHVRGSLNYITSEYFDRVGNANAGQIKGKDRLRIRAL